MSNYLQLVPVQPNMRLVPAKPLPDYQAPLLARSQKKCRKLLTYEIIELVAWIVLLVHNGVLYWRTQKHHHLNSIFFLFVLSLTQPTFYLVSIQSRHKYMNTIASGLILLLSLYIGTRYYSSKQFHHHHHSFVTWIRVSQYLQSGFTLWGLIKQCQKQNHRSMAIFSSIFLAALTYSIEWFKEGEFRLPEIIIFILAGISALILVLKGGRFLRFLTKFVLVGGQLYIVYLDSSVRTSNLGHELVFLSRMFSLLHMILSLRAIWKIELDEYQFYNRL